MSRLGRAAPKNANDTMAEPVRVHFALLVNLGDDRLFVEPFISTTTTAEDDVVTFTGSVGLSERAFSKRYADMEKLLAGVAR